MKGNVFHKWSLSEILEDRKCILLQKIAYLEELDAANIPQKMQELIDEFTIFPLEITNILAADQTKERPRAGFSTPKTHTLPVLKPIEIVIEINFEGGFPTLLSTYPANAKPIFLHEDTRIEGLAIHTKVVLPDYDVAKYQEEITKIKAQLAPTIALINAEFDIWNKGLEAIIKPELEKRLVFLTKRNAFWEAIQPEIIPDRRLKYHLPKLPLNLDLESKVVLKQVVLARAALAELKGIASSFPSPEILIFALPLQEAKEYRPSKTL